MPQHHPAPSQPIHDNKRAVALTWLLSVVMVVRVKRPGSLDPSWNCDPSVRRLVKSGWSDMPAWCGRAWRDGAHMISGTKHAHKDWWGM